MQMLDNERDMPDSNVAHAQSVLYNGCVMKKTTQNSTPLDREYLDKALENSQIANREYMDKGLAANREYMDKALEKTQTSLRDYVDKSLREQSMQIFNYVEGRFSEFNQKIDDLSDKTDARFDRIERILDKSSSDYKTLVAENAADASAHSRFDNKLDDHETRIGQLENLELNSQGV